MSVYVVRVNGSPFVRFSHNSAFNTVTVFRGLMPEAKITLKRVSLKKKA